MTTRRRGLARGLETLMAPTGATPTPAPGAVRFAELPVDAISPNPRQPRAHFDDDALDELVASLREVGMLQPVVVRAVDAGRYELVMGERRWRAATAAGLDVVPAIIRETADDEMLRHALLENLHREQLNPLEEAAAYAQLIEEFGATHDEVAARVGRSRSHVSNTLRLLQLPPPVQRRLAAGVLTAGHARALLALRGPAEQEALAARIVAEGLSVRAVEEAVAVPESPAAPRAMRPRAATPSGFADLAAALSDRFDTRVTVQLGRAKGKLVVQFATVADLERLLDMIAPGMHGGTGPPRPADD